MNNTAQIIPPQLSACLPKFKVGQEYTLIKVMKPRRMGSRLEDSKVKYIDIEHEVIQ